MSQFEKLLAELSAEQEEQTTLAKALPADGGEDDEAIQAAAAEGDAELPENPEDEDDDDDEEGVEPLTKSMVIDGEEVNVVDADALIKSHQALVARFDANESVLAKALESTVATIKAQGEMIKSLAAKYDKLAGQGSGRKTVLTVHEAPSPTMAKAEDPAGLQAADVLAKAHTAFSENKITGLELTTIDVALRSNQKIEPGLLAKALS